eukprot:Skav204813  [mRNA]  locus=scaffold3914:2163:4296:- [translate_table: standard]
MPELRDNVLSGRSLPEVYAYTFGVALEPPCKLLPLEEAAQYWALLLPEWPLREDFCAWALKHMKGKAINRDLWMMILKLATEVPADLSTFHENPAWPVVLDDFVECSTVHLCQALQFFPIAHCHHYPFHSNSPNQRW